MKEKIILEITSQMADCLTVEQTAQLNSILLKVMGEYTIIIESEQKQEHADSNESLLSSFLSAKQVEGCSAPTIRYYGNTVKKLFKKMPKRCTDYTTEDIRAFLAVFQQKQKVSRVTVDNVRRIFSSFFAWLSYLEVRHFVLDGTMLIEC